MYNTVKDELKLLIQNPVFLAALFSWFSAQFIKTCINLIGGKINSLHELIEFSVWRTGSMPSSHSALVISVCTTIGCKEGIGSDIFILSLCFALVVIRDAVGVRRSSGMQGKMINKIGKSLEEITPLKYHPLKEVHGHKPIEVFVGSLLGLFIGLAFSVL